MRRRLCNLALKTALRSLHPKFKLGAVVVQGSRVLSKGTNIRRSLYAMMSSSDRHAECSALVGTPPGPKTIYVARVTKQGSPAMAFPCSKCMEHLKENEVKRIVYTDQNGIWRVQNI